jgi:pimeloyl-ACP methyl ester carboxylesterase
MIQVNGLSLHIEQLDPGDAVSKRDASATVPAPVGTVVLLHGLAVGSLATWYLTLANSFAQAGLRVIMYDLRGHGHSERPTTGYRLDDHVDDLEALLTGLAIASPVHLIGVSYGGTIAFGYALRHPGNVAGVAAIESVPMTARWSSWLAANVDAGSGTPAVSAGFGMALPPRVRKAAEQLAAETTLRQDVLASRVSSEQEFAALDMPVFCIYGGDSSLSGMAHYVEQMFQRARSVVLPGQRHTILIDDPLTVGKLLMSWLCQDCGVPLRSSSP